MGGICGSYLLASGETKTFKNVHFKGTLNNPYGEDYLIKSNGSSYGLVGGRWESPDKNDGLVFKSSSIECTVSDGLTLHAAWDETGEPDGNYSYYIYNANGMVEWAKLINPNAGEDDTVTNYATLQDDIDLKGISWVAPSSRNFNFNGNGHTISNVYCVAAEGEDAYWRAGLFGSGSGTFENLILKNVTAKGAQAGALMGQTDGIHVIHDISIGGKINITYTEAKNNSGNVEGDPGLGFFFGTIGQRIRSAEKMTITSDCVASFEFADMPFDTEFGGTKATTPMETVTAQRFFTYASWETKPAQYAEIEGDFTKEEGAQINFFYNGTHYLGKDHYGIDSAAMIPAAYNVLQTDKVAKSAEGSDEPLIIEIMNDITVTDADIAHCTSAGSGLGDYTFSAVFDLEPRNHMNPNFHSKEGEYYGSSFNRPYVITGGEEGHTITSKLTEDVPIFYVGGGCVGATFENFTIKGNAKSAIHVSDDVPNITLNNVTINGTYTNSALYLTSCPVLAYIENCKIEGGVHVGAYDAAYITGAETEIDEVFVEGRATKNFMYGYAFIGSEAAENVGIAACDGAFVYGAGATIPAELAASVSVTTGYATEKWGTENKVTAYFCDLFFALNYAGSSTTYNHFDRNLNSQTETEITVLKEVDMDAEFAALKALQTAGKIGSYYNFASNKYQLYHGVTLTFAKGVTTTEWKAEMFEKAADTDEPAMADGTVTVNGTVIA